MILRVSVYAYIAVAHCHYLIDYDLCRNVGKIRICFGLAELWHHRLQHNSQRISLNIYIPEMICHVPSSIITFQQTFVTLQMQLRQPTIDSTITTVCYYFQFTVLCEIRDLSEIRDFDDDDYEDYSILWCDAVYSCNNNNNNNNNNNKGKFSANCFRIKYWDRCEGNRKVILSCSVPFCILLNAAIPTVSVILV